MAVRLPATLFPPDITLGSCRPRHAESHFPGSDHQSAEAGDLSIIELSLYESVAACTIGSAAQLRTYADEASQYTLVVWPVPFLPFMRDDIQSLTQFSRLAFQAIGSGTGRESWGQLRRSYCSQPGT